MQLRARFRPHRRGFGFLVPVAIDGATPTTFRLPDVAKEHDSAFVPPTVARGLVADDLVDAEVEADDKGVSATQVTVVDRPRRMLVGAVQFGPGGLVLEPDRTLGSGWVQLAETLAPRLRSAVGRQVVLLCGEAADGSPVGRALVAGPHVVGSPQAIRASAAVIGLGRAAPGLIPGGAAIAGLDPAQAGATHTRVIGHLAGGGRGAAAGLSVDGYVPARDMLLSDRLDEPCVTVDDAASRDLDDAVAAFWDASDASPVRVVVHIADVAAVVGLDSPADTYARTVATTAYLASGPNAPMLDPALAEDALSLLPGAQRQTLSVRFAVAPDGAIGDVEVEAALMESRAKLSYAALDAWLEGDRGALSGEAGSATAAAEGVLAAAFEASRRLGVERDARRTFEELFEQAEVTPALVNGKLATVAAEPHAQAYRLIERLMVAANEAVARWLVDHDVPALYRAHVGVDPDRLAWLRAAAELAGAEIPSLPRPQPDGGEPSPEAGVDVAAIVAEVLAAVEKLEANGREEDRNLLVAAATATTARARYEPDPSHHRGLGSGAYVHFTSPIRRYADLVVHRAVRAALGGEAPVRGAAELGPLAAWLDTRSGAVRAMVARERADLWARLLDRGYLATPEPAIVTGVSANGLKIRLPRLGLTSFVPAERALGLPSGQRGRLQVDAYGLTTTSGPWRVGSRLSVAYVGLDDAGRPILRPADVPPPR